MTAPNHEYTQTQQIQESVKISNGASGANLLLMTDGILITTVSEFLQYIVIASKISKHLKYVK